MFNTEFSFSLAYFDFGQPHAAGQPRALTFTPGTPARSAHPQRHPVSVASGEGKAPLPNARRRARVRGTKR